MRRFLFTGLILNSLAVWATGHQDAETILDCVRANVPDSTLTQKIELRSVDRQGYEQTMRATVYRMRSEDGLSRVLMHFHEPLDISDARLLTIENKPESDLYVYVPGLMKVRRISSTGISSSVMGTDFSYEDFERVQKTFRDSRTELLPDVVVDGHRSHVLQSVPPDGSAYEKIVTYVDSKTCMIVRTKLYEPGDQLRKVMAIAPEDISRRQGVWTARKLLMSDLRDETHTTLVVQDFSVGDELDPRMFDPGQLAEYAQPEPEDILDME